nr:unnamed protein product [Spirometra erinaceieuropaei]
MTNTVFRRPMRNKVTWIHPRSLRWQPLDCVLVRASDRQGVLMTDAICDSDGWTDHCFVISKMRLRLQAHGRPQVKRPLGNLRPPAKRTVPRLSSYGLTLLTKGLQVLKRWAEHLGSFLNRPSTISDAAIDRFPKVEINVDLDLPPSLTETIRAMQQLFSGKAPGSEAVTAETYEHGDHQSINQLTSLSQEM